MLLVCLLVQTQTDFTLVSTLSIEYGGSISNKICKQKKKIPFLILELILSIIYTLKEKIA